MDRDTEMMICLVEQGYNITLDNKTIGFDVFDIVTVLDILYKEKKSSNC